MDQIFGKVSFKSRNSIADSITMSILQSSMNRAHEKVRSKEGAIGRLHEISKFYELALVQLDGCQKFVQEEADSSLESSDEETIGELAEIRERLQWRLKEAELAIEQKDRELVERLDNEVKLRCALEIKQRELDSLRRNFDVERRNSEGLEELLVLGNSESGDEEISELKSSVDQQVFNIRQKLGSDGDLVSRKMSTCSSDLEIEGMRSDIDILKETMDIAFGRMQNAILLTGLGPVECQLEQAIERDIVAILIKGFIEDIEESLNAGHKKKEREVLRGPRKRFAALFKEVTSLREELRTLSTFCSDFKGKSFWKAKGSSSEGDSCGKLISNVGGIEQMKQTEKEDRDDDSSSHFVAKMIKSHESVIRRKSEELNWLKREIIKDRGLACINREKHVVSLSQKIQDTILKLENLISWNTELAEDVVHEEDGGDEVLLAEKLHNNDKVEQEKSWSGSFEDAWRKTNTFSIFHEEDGLCNELPTSKEEKEAKDSQKMVTEEVNLTLLRGSHYKFYGDSYIYELEILLRERMLDEFLKEIINEWNEKLERDMIMDQIGEEIFAIVISLTMNNHCTSLGHAMLEREQWKARCNHLEDLIIEGNIIEWTFRTLLKEIYSECNEIMEGRNGTEIMARPEMSLATEEEATISLDGAPPNNPLSEANTADSLEVFDHSQSEKSCIDEEYLIIEEMQMIFFKEMCKEWMDIVDACSLESFVRDSIFLLVISEVLKQASSIYREANKAYADSGIPQHSTVTNKLHQLSVAKVEHSLIRHLDSQLECLVVAEDSTHSQSHRLKVDGRKLDFRGIKYSRTNKIDRSKELLGEMRSASIAVRSDINIALEQLTKSTSRLNELRTNLGIPVKTKHSHDQAETTITRAESMMPSGCSKMLEMTPFDQSSFTSLVEFTQVLTNFKSKAEERIELQILRLEEAKDNFTHLSELVGSVKRKKRLYKRAFISRCESLKKAEIEVDLLGDQVDVFIGILEHTHLVLHQHKPDLQRYIPVLDVLEMIDKELFGSVVGADNNFASFATTI